MDEELSNSARLFMFYEVKYLNIITSELPSFMYSILLPGAATSSVYIDK